MPVTVTAQVLASVLLMVLRLHTDMHVLLTRVSVAAFPCLNLLYHPYACTLDIEIERTTCVIEKPHWEISDKSGVSCDSPCHFNQRLET